MRSHLRVSMIHKKGVLMVFYSFVFVILLSVAQSLQSFAGKSFMAYRSQGSHPERFNEFSFFDNFLEQGSLSVIYDHSFNQHAINKYFFGSDSIIFSGSRVQNRGESDILADYFGLPTDFKSKIYYHPMVSNVIVNAYYAINLTQLSNNLFLTINAPVTYSKWALNPCEQVIDPGSLAYPAGYMSNERIEYTQLMKGALDVLRDQKTFGDVTQPLSHGQIKNEQHSLKVADIKAALEYVWYEDDQKQCNGNIHCIIPCGTKSKAIALFEPQIGNGHHWGIGAELSAYYNFCEKDASFQCAAALSGEVRHLFASKQYRSYDLIHNGPGSRYMLLEDMITRVSITQGFSNTLPPFPLLENQYITRLVHAIDATTLESKIKIDVEANFIAKLEMEYRDWNGDFGYNLWARSPEKLVKREKLAHYAYGIKGDAQVYDFLDIGLFVIPIPNNATQSQATLYKPQGDGNTTQNFVNLNADNAALIYNAGAPMIQTKPNSVAGTGVTSVANTRGSNQAIILNDCDIDNDSGLSPKAISHSVFGSIGRSWQSDEAVIRFAIGAEGEFSQSFNCRKNSISQWSAWIKGTVSY